MTTNEQILEELHRLYPVTKSELNFTNAFEMLVATILSAQCTDKQVNKTTSVLFQHFKTPEDFAALQPEELEPYIHSCGFYHNKAKNIISASRQIVKEYGGQVPDSLEELVKLPGVGRKTANVVFANAFGGDAIAVDTHVFRVSNRLGLAQAKDVLKTELQLQQAIPKELWSTAHHWLIYHGRRVCRASRPACGECTLRKLCRFANEQQT